MRDPCRKQGSCTSRTLRLRIHEGTNMLMTRTIGWLAAAVFSAAAVGAHAQAKAPEALIKEVSTDVLEAVKADKSIRAGDIRKVIALVDQKVLPYVNFQRMTAAA